MIFFYFMNHDTSVFWCFRLTGMNAKIFKSQFKPLFCWFELFLGLENSYLSSERWRDCNGLARRCPDSSNWYKCAEMPLRGQVGQIATLPLICVCEITDIVFRKISNWKLYTIFGTTLFILKLSDLEIIIKAKKFRSLFT